MRRNSPNVTMVMGSVKSTSIGLTSNRRSAITIATIIADPYPSTETPGKILANITTANAVRSNLIISFILFNFFDWRLKIKKPSA